MNKNDIKPYLKVKNKKYGTIEQVLFICKMKDSQKGWIDAVAYAGTDRFTSEYNVFCKNMNDFCNEFEIEDKK